MVRGIDSFRKWFAGFEQLGLAGYTMEEVIDGLREIYLQESGHTG